MKEYRILPDGEMQKQNEYRDLVRAIVLARAEERGEPLKAFVQTFGCQQNEADSEKIAGMCRSMGYEVCYTPEEADIIMVNTCAVREHAEQKALSIVGQYKHLKAAKPDMLIGVCGCMVTQEHRKETIKHSYPYVDFVLGTSSLHRLPELIFTKIQKGKRLYCPEEKEYLVAEGLPIYRESSYRAWVSIMYGCNNFCTYCIVPYVRGRERSRRPEDIIAEVRELVESGYKDITLLGQNVNSYGKDAKSDDGEIYDFADLLRDIDKIEGDYFIRFMTSHPKDASDELISVMRENTPKIAPFFHLPLQSGSTEILRSMNRTYTQEKYLSIAYALKDNIPGIALSTDVIIGFPGESDADFEDTMDVLSQIRFDNVYSFLFSPREGTRAAKMTDVVPREVKDERMARLLALQDKVSLENNLKYEQTEQRVLIDSFELRDGKTIFSARTLSNKPVYFESDRAKVGEFINVKIIKACPYHLLGEVEK